MTSSALEGYDCDFVNEVYDDFICAVCSLVLRDPVQLEACGHRLCRTCYEGMKEYSLKRYFQNIIMFLFFSFLLHTYFHTILALTYK